MTDFVGLPPFIRVTLANIVLVCLLARKKTAPLSDLASLKCLLWTILTHCSTGIFITRWVEKESEIGLFFDLALCL